MKSYRGNATRLSRLMRDELMPSKELGTYWIEHVLRHNGAKHLQLAGKDLPFYQKYLIDVILFLVGLILILVVISFLLIRWFLRKCFAQTSSKAEQKVQ